MRTAARIDGLGTTIFTEMTALAERTGSINLGQGFPDHGGPAEVIEAAVQALRGGANQYAPLSGVSALREAVLEHQRRCYGLEPEDVLVTFGATEAIAAALLALCEPGDEVVLFEPYYDSYPACVSFAGAKRRVVTLEPPSFKLDRDRLLEAIEGGHGRARVIVVNTPHNPTGRVFGRAELTLVAETCAKHDLVCISDEVYEHLVYEGEHVPVASLPGMAERTLTVSSVGKSFSLTGWKIGWCSGRHVLRERRYRSRREPVLRRTPATLRRGRDPDRRLLRRSRCRSEPCPLRVLQAAGGHRRSRSAPGLAHLISPGPGANQSTRLTDAPPAGLLGAAAGPWRRIRSGSRSGRWEDRRRPQDPQSGPEPTPHAS